jgi:HK97 family phage major capsid protein
VGCRRLSFLQRFPTGGNRGTIAMRLKALLERKKTLAAEMIKLRDTISAENRDFTAEENERWEAINRDYSANERNIEIENRATDVERQLTADAERTTERRPAAGESRGAGNITNELADLASSAWFSHQLGHRLSPAQIDAAQRCGINPAGKYLDFDLVSTRQYRDLQRAARIGRADSWQIGAANLNVAAGAANVIEQSTLLRQLEINLLAFGGMRKVADTIRTATGETISWPTTDDTGNTGALLAEETTFGTSVAPTLSKTQWGAFKFSSHPVLVSAELLEDSVFNLPEIIGGMLGERLGRGTNPYYTTGTGGGTQPTGLIVGASLGVTAAAAAAITADELIDLQHSVDAAYRDRPGAGWMAKDATFAYLRKLKASGSGEYLWMPGGLDAGIAGGMMNLLLGKPFTVNYDMASMATGNKTLAFGDLSAYKIRTVGQVRMYRLQERYRDTDQDAFVAFLREDGKLLNAGTNPVKYLQQA